MREDDVIRFTCTSVGGNPSPLISWTLKGGALPGAYYSAAPTKYGNATSSLVFTMKRTDDMVNITCHVKNEATEGDGLWTTERLSVHCEHIQLFISYLAGYFVSSFISY